MHINRPVLYKILATVSCFILIAACAPIRTGDVDRGHRPVYSLTAGDEEQDGRLQGDVEPESEKTKAQELKDLQLLGKWEQGVPAVEYSDREAQSDFPVTMNRQVQYYLDFFSGKQRESFARWLSRSGRYLPMIHEHLRAAGLPEDLIYLAMIESGFNERAYSQASAVGVWQFIKSTGQNYGLEINNYVDERRDPVKSTQAAVSYLSDLYNEFGSWYLAVAAYNAGEGKIRRAIKQYETTDFWEIAQGRYLQLETKRYVPKLIAAIIIAREPEKYGFDNITYEAPLAYETVEVPRWTSVKAIALACDLDQEELKKYNNELHKDFTPPDRESYAFKVPAGKGKDVEKNLPRVQAVVATGFKTHKVRKGETLSAICNRYDLTKTVVLKSNNLGSAGLQVGQRLRIPYQTITYEMLPEGTLAKGYMAAGAADGSFLLHKVRKGETVSELARLYNAPIHLIAAWNDMKDIGNIQVGQQLVFYVQDTATKVASVSPGTDTVRHFIPERLKKAVKDDTTQKKVEVERAAVRADQHNSASEKYYLVKKGDSLGEIARQFGLNSQELKKLNTLASDIIRPGDKLVVGTRSRQAAAEFYYQIRSGDSLWTIARQYDVSPVEIRKWNNLHDDMIHPGNRLLLRVADAGEPMVDTYYQVRSGDSLWTIARQHNISPDEIKKWNNLQGSTIHPGNRLVLKIATGG